MKLGVVGTMSELVASEAPSFLNVTLMLFKRKVDSADLGVSVRVRSPPAAVHRVRKLPLVVEFGCPFVPVVNGGWQWGVAVDLVAQSVVETGLEEGYLRQIFGKSGPADKVSELDNVFVRGSVALLERHKCEAVLGFVVNGPEDLLEFVDECGPCSVIGGVIVDEGNLPWTSAPTLEVGKGPGYLLLVSVELGCTKHIDVILAICEEFDGILSV